MSTVADEQSGSDASGDISQQADAGVAPRVSNPLDVDVPGTHPTLASSPRGAPDLELVEPGVFDDLHGDPEDPAVGGEIGNLPPRYQPVASSEAASILGSEELEGIYDDAHTSL